MLKTSLYITSIILLFSACVINAEQPDIEAYGKLPEIRALSISPDGKHYAYLKREKDMHFFVVRDAETQSIVFAADTSRFKARSTGFASNKYVLLWGSKTRRSRNYGVLLEDGGALVYNIETGKTKVLLKALAQRRIL